MALEEEERRKAELPNSFDLEDHLPYRISMLTNLIRQVTTDRYVRETRISGREWRVLCMIGLHPKMSAVDVVRLTGMDKATVTRAVDRLSKQGLVTRALDPNDGRRKVLELTAEGTVECDRILPMMREGGDFFDSALTGTERAELFRLLDKLRSKAEERLQSNIS